MPKVRRVLIVLGVPVLLLLFAWCAAVVAAFSWQSSFLYPAPAVPRQVVAPGAELLTLTGPSGPVRALCAPAAPGHRTVLHLHGNGEDLSDAGWLISALRREGLGVCSVEYPGYGLSRAQPPSERALVQAAEVAAVHLERAGARLALLGVSLGTGVAVDLALRGHGERLALVAPYTSMGDVGAHHFPWLPVRWLLRDRYDSARKVPLVLQPALIVHGTEDEVIPFALGERLAQLLPHARLVAVPGAHHNDVLGAPVLAELARWLDGASTTGDAPGPSDSRPPR
jgi:pimeloyl-ACP methyl ester carboxylesterase